MRKPHTKSFDLFDTYKYCLPGIRGMLILFGMFIIGALAGNFVSLLLMKAAGDGVLDDYMMLITYPIQFIPAMMYASYSSAANSMRLSPVPLDKWRAGSGAVPFAIAAVVATFCSSVLCEPLESALGEMPQFLKEALEKLLDAPLWATLVCVGIFAPFFEEWLCRGIILRGLLSRMKPWAAIVISAAFFAVIHMNPWQAIPAFLLGSLFGLVYYKTGSLKLTMLMHCANNSLSVLLSRLPGCEEADYLWQITGKPLYLGICAAGLCLVAAFIVWTLKKSASTV